MKIPNLDRQTSNITHFDFINWALQEENPADLNITDRHEMTGKDQNQSEGKVWNTLSSLPSWLGASCLLTGDVCLSGFHSEACLKSDSLSYE